MDLLNVKLYRYRIPCKTGVILRHQPLTERQGLIIQLEQQGKIGLGEIAPLIGFSQETLQEAEKQTKMWIADQTVPLEQLAPSVAFGISCALEELKGKLLPDLQENVPSAILCDGDFSIFSKKIARQNKPLGKIKIGFNAEKEGKLAQDLLQTFPHLILRLDANRTWTLAQAVIFAEKIAKPLRSRIQFIEEPCQTPALSQQFALETEIAIAWDESVREPNFQVEKSPYLRAIVLKPTLIGSLSKCIHLIEQAKQQNLQVVISSSLESSLGLSQLARFARQYTPESIPGLDTLHLMQYQLVRSWQGSTLPLIDLPLIDLPLIDFKENASSFLQREH